MKNNTVAAAVANRPWLLRVLIITGGAMAFMGFSGVVMGADAPTGCAAKTAHLEAELDTAQRAHADKARIDGLRVALAKSKLCDDKTLARERADKVKQKQRKVAEREEVLDRELRDGDANRISRAKQKLDRATKELDAAREEQSS